MATDKNTLMFVFNVHFPFVRESSARFVSEEIPFFESITYSFLPFLRMLDRLEEEHVPFHGTLALPVLTAEMLSDKLLQERYLTYLDQQLEFGEREIKRVRGTATVPLAEHYFASARNIRDAFCERYGKNIVKALYRHTKHGGLELMMSAAVNAYLPFYEAYPEAIAAQIETALLCQRVFSPKQPRGFYLPELAWGDTLDHTLRSYHFEWTVVDTHTALLGRPVPTTGVFEPLRSQMGLVLFARDFHAMRELTDDKVGLWRSPVFRSTPRDAGYDLPSEVIESFLSKNGGRLPTGYRYYANGDGRGQPLYNPLAAQAAAREAARAFVMRRSAALAQASALIGKKTISVVAMPLDFLGRRWYEGWQFFEEVVRQCAREDMQVTMATPGGFLEGHEYREFQRLTPECSSAGKDGYGDAYLDSSNDWLYRHLLRAIGRMVEVSERFGDDSGMRERLLNQAAREVLLATDTKWARWQAASEPPVVGDMRDAAKDALTLHLRNFTTLYEALCRGEMCTRFLTNLEENDNVFPEINFRSFHTKREPGQYA
jgi:1,4-alpha-glucan branching enzyme